MTHYVMAAGQKTMTTLESAEFLGVSRNAVHSFLKDGRLKGSKNDSDEWEITIASLNLLKNTGNYRRWKRTAASYAGLKQEKAPEPVKTTTELVDGDFIELRLKVKRDKFELVKLALARKDKNPSQWLLENVEKAYEEIVTALGMTNIG